MTPVRSKTRKTVRTREIHFQSQSMLVTTSNDNLTMHTGDRWSLFASQAILSCVTFHIRQLEEWRISLGSSAEQLKVTSYYNLEDLSVAVIVRGVWKMSFDVTLWSVTLLSNHLEFVELAITDARNYYVDVWQNSEGFNMQVWLQLLPCKSIDRHIS